MSFITVKFGDDKHALFNPNCFVVNLLDNIRRRCKCAKEIAIDLSDEDGVIQKLAEQYQQNASCILRERGEYILLRIEKIPDQPCSYCPLLNGLEFSNPDLLAKLQNIPKPEEELPKPGSHPRKKSPWDRISGVRKAAAKAKELTNASTGRISGESGKEGQLKMDEKHNGERKTAKQRRSALVKTQ